MDIQSNSMSQRMDIAFERGFRVERRFVSLGFEILTGHALVIDKRCIEVEILHDLIVDFMDLVIESLRFRSCVSQAPGAGEIIEISTALSQPGKYRRQSSCPGSCKSSGSPTECGTPASRPMAKIVAFHIHGAAFGKPERNPAFYIANGERSVHPPSTTLHPRALRTRSDNPGPSSRRSLSPRPSGECAPLPHRPLFPWHAGSSKSIPDSPINSNSGISFASLDDETE